MVISFLVHLPHNEKSDVFAYACTTNVIKEQKKDVANAKMANITVMMFRRSECVFVGCFTEVFLVFFRYTLAGKSIFLPSVFGGFARSRIKKKIYPSYG